MKLLLALTLSVSLLASGGPPSLDAGQFTSRCAKALRKALPRVEVRVVRDLELRVVGGKGETHTVFLYNAFANYRSAPDDVDGVIARYVAAAVDAQQDTASDFSRERIVPVVKVHSWIEEARRATVGAGKPARELPLVWEELSGDLVVVYAVDREKNMAFLPPKRFAELGLSKGDLRRLAVKNVMALLPRIETRGGDGLFMITAGGDYEASLLLADAFWEKRPVKVKGDYVVAVPTRDLLLVSGSDDTAGIAKLREIARKAVGEASYALTDALFVRRDGRFVPLP